MVLSPVTPTPSWISQNSKTQADKSFTQSQSYVTHGPLRCIKVHGAMTMRPGQMHGPNKLVLQKKTMAFFGCHSKHFIKSIII